MADYSVTKANVQNSSAGQVISGDSAEAVDAGDAVYKTSAGKYGKANAAGATPLYKVIGIALDTADGADQPISICTDDPDFVPGFTADAGQIVIVSGVAAGNLCPAGDLANDQFCSVVGVMLENNHMRLRITRSDVAAVVGG
jgi:hypothetical protein